MFSRAAAIVLAVSAFGMLASASPVTDVLARGDQLTAVLNLILDLQVKIAAVLKLFGESPMPPILRSPLTILSWAGR